MTSAAIDKLTATGQDPTNVVSEHEGSRLKAQGSSKSFEILLKGFCLSPEP